MTAKPVLPGEGLDVAKMPAYLLLAQLGKRVLRPGGRRMTEGLLRSLNITSSDDVVEFAPGVGGTTRKIMRYRPASYIGIEQDARGADVVNTLLDHPVYHCLHASAQETGLAAGSADVVLGEAFLTMQPPQVKQEIVAEAFRVLRPGGRYALHELALWPNDLDDAEQDQIRSELTSAVHTGAKPITIAAWRELLEEAGFEIVAQETRDRGLLTPRRVIDDEGLFRAAKIGFKVLRDPQVRSRVRQIHQSMSLHEANICALSLVARRPR